MIQQFSYNADLISIVTCAVLGLCFLVIPVPKNPHLDSYKTSLRYLSFAYLLLSGLTCYYWATNQSYIFVEFLSFPNLLVSSLQSLLVFFALITLLDNQYVTKKRVVYQLTPILVFFSLYLCFSLLGDDPSFKISSLFQYIHKPIVILRAVFFLYYTAQLSHFTFVFFKVENNYDARLNNYFADTFNLRLLRVRFAFLCALFIGFFSLFLHFAPSIYYNDVFTIAYTLFYLVLALVYISYNSIFSKIEQVVESVENEDEQPLEIKKQPRRSAFVWTDLKEQILEQKTYLKQGVTVDEMSRALGIGRTTLSAFINNEESLNFNTWINTLRIEEAKRILIEQPNLTLQSIAEMTGFSEQSNFSKQFKTLTGCAPSVWRQKAISK